VIRIVLRGEIAGDGSFDRAWRVGLVTSDSRILTGRRCRCRPRSNPDVAAHHAREQAADGQSQGAGAGLRLRNPQRAALERCEEALEIARLDCPGRCRSPRNSRPGCGKCTTNVTLPACVN